MFLFISLVCRVPQRRGRDTFRFAQGRVDCRSRLIEADASGIFERLPSASPLHSPSPTSPFYPPLAPEETSALDFSTTHLDTQVMDAIKAPDTSASLVTLAVQNAALSIVMQYSRVSTPQSRSYSPASAVLLNELLKGLISFFIALARTPTVASQPWHRMYNQRTPLSIPALLYVIQNSLQFVAVINLSVASFQVTYQLKILTTAAFSVALLRRCLTPAKWVSLLFLALGVGIVQIPSQTTTRERAGFAAFTLACFTSGCFTSGLAGVYFEIVLKGNNTVLWVRNVQLALFSLVPALLPVMYASNTHSHSFRHFTPSAWATVAVQVLGGLFTAVVIIYSDNIMKGFATSLSIILSFLAFVALFDFRITPSFVLGASTVLGATWVYNRSEGGEPFSTASGYSTPFPGTPFDARSDPILGHFPATNANSHHPPPPPAALTPYGGPTFTVVLFTSPVSCIVRRC
ncbi:nucleotide-sugar transporter-domain-containing protein [Mycena metata]|uniref:Nucleotide-sugar transporter-domain-containing protein n=1 Tax=Mycena metata TaxID=1033252 RepID=A0AAD7IW64_9AGAR|nr:nucleotide-sugar transporter-domain-containing protein [Mycena metata]